MQRSRIFRELSAPLPPAILVRYDESVEALIGKATLSFLDAALKDTSIPEPAEAVAKQRHVLDCKDSDSALQRIALCKLEGSMNREIMRHLRRAPAP